MQKIDVHQFIDTLRSVKIGIWGLGIAGKAAVRFFSSLGIPVAVHDQRQLTEQEQLFLAQAQAKHIPILDQFLHQYDVIIPSQGIDLRPWQRFKHKFLSELDIFMRTCSVPFVAITGSIGKTTLTILLKELLSRYYHSVQMGGNVGVGLFDLIYSQAQYHVIELSSFQLEQSTFCAPDLTIISNIYPNHLDRHNSMEEYRAAKLKSICYQQSHQKALLPLSCLEYCLPFFEHKERYSFFSMQPPCQEIIQQHPELTFYWLHANKVVQEKQHQQHIVADISSLPFITYQENILILTAALHILQIPTQILDTLETVSVLEHRFERLGTYKEIDFYNDSKATIMESTLAAIQTLQKKPIILLLGGLSKGVNRVHYLEQLKQVKLLVCFGKEAGNLAENAHKFGIATAAYDSLQEAFIAAIAAALPGDQVIFSPGGSSYDLFANYQERGTYFKKLLSEIK